VKQRQERFSELRARRDLERAESQSVVCRIEGQNPRPARREVRCLEGDLYSVGPGGREIDTRVVYWNPPTKLTCQFHSRGMSVYVAEAVNEPRGLPANRGHDQGVSMAHRGDSEPGCQVEVSVAIHVEHIGAQSLLPDQSIFTQAKGIDTRRLVVAQVST
jgi:hypothetical protein